MTRVADETTWQICWFAYLCSKFLRKCALISPFPLTMYILLDIIEYGMINSTSHQSWLFYSPLAKQAVLLKDDLLDPVDQLLEDPALVDLVQQCLAARSPASARTGRPGIPPDRVLRCCVMKHLKGWSFRDLERELRSNLEYRRFTPLYSHATANSPTFCRPLTMSIPQANPLIL